MPTSYFLTVANNVRDTLIPHLHDYPLANRSDVLALILQQVVGGMIMHFEAGDGAEDGQWSHYFNRTWSEDGETSYDIDIAMHTLDDAYTQIQVTEAGELWEEAIIATEADVTNEAYMLAKVIAIRANMETVVQRLRGIMEVVGRPEEDQPEGDKGREDDGSMGGTEEKSEC